MMFSSLLKSQVISQALYQNLPALICNDIGGDFEMKQKHGLYSKWLPALYYHTSLGVHMLLNIFSA